MARYIDVDKADVERISCFYGGECRLEDVQEWLDEQPTADVVKVVRCKDCKYYGAVGCLTMMKTKNNDYCSYGRKKEGG